jgi:hypothetical protein
MKGKVYWYALRIFGWPFRKTDGILGKGASWIEKSGLFRFLRSLEAVAIGAALILFWLDLGDRKADRDNRAWSLIAAVSGEQVIGNIGGGNALEILNSDGVSLDGIHLPGAWLDNVNLSGAELKFGHFEEAYLVGANLSGADLVEANLSGADLSQAKLSLTNLSAANFLETIGLSQAQIDVACFRKEQGEVVLPDGFRQPPECPEHVQK